jgi:hypothetical protein
VITDLGTLGGKESTPAAINERGQIVGWSTGGDQIRLRPVFMSNRGHGLWFAMDADGSDVRAIRAPFDRAENVAWSPDASHVAYSNDSDGGLPLFGRVSAYPCERPAFRPASADVPYNQEVGGSIPSPPIRLCGRRVPLS